MKSYVMQPTRENLIRTFENDAIGRNADIFRFADILDSIEDSCTVALDASWGSGKTFFVRQVKLWLDAHNDFISSLSDDEKEKVLQVGPNGCDSQLQSLRPQVTVYYDAWENDNDDDPVLSLIYTILKEVDADLSKPIKANTIEIAAKILRFFTGKDWPSLIDSFKREDPLAQLRKEKAIEDEIKTFLDELVDERGERLVVFVDELDRCTPSYAVRLLERIKHYFSNDRITFVFSVNTVELQHTIKSFYGNDFDACRYLDRFFDLRVTLPEPDLCKFYRSLNFDDNNNIYDEVCAAVIKKYRFSLRETAKYIKLTQIAAYKPTHSKKFNFYGEKAAFFCLYYVVPLMIGLKMTNISEYMRFIQGKNSAPLIEICKLFENHVLRLLSNQEKFYNPRTNGETVADVSEKVQQVYEALFNTEYIGSVFQIEIGDCTFREETKNVLMRVESLLSLYAEFN